MTLKIIKGLSVEEASRIEDELIAFADAFTGPRNRRQFSLGLRDQEGNVVGGSIGDTVWDWLQLSTLWVAEEFRGRGYGHELLIRTEELGVKRGCRFARVSTWGFEAKGFYQSHGYGVYGQLDDFPAGHTQYFMKKSL